MENLTEAQVVSFLVKMADDLDREGNHSLASEVDDTLKAFSARPRAPLKQLDDDVKKNLIIFVHDADQGTGKSIKGLKELFRRLRYFDLADAVKELGLDRTVRDMEKTQGGLCEAKKKLYEMMMGRKPSVQALDDFLGVAANDGATDQSALDFFESQAPVEDELMPEEDEEHEEHEEHEEYEEDEEDEELAEELEDELEEFLAGLEDEDEGDEE